jgi:endonuclease-3
VNKILETLELIEKQIKEFKVPSVTLVSKKKDPFRVLISCILSLRTKDKTTLDASNKLFMIADSPKGILKLSFLKLEKIIYPVGFYRNKARVILGIARDILENYAGKVPDTIEGLLKLKGVGRKTANLVLSLGFNIPAICVDTHVHRITNRLGWVKTKTPEETEEALKKIIQKKYWIDLNTTLVTFGQNLCVPISPFCSRCFVFKFCARQNVGKSR